MNEPLTDGRRIKGEQRKRELIEATIRVVARDGVAGVSHRTVSKEAGQPATAAAYYFRTIDDLLTAALTSCMDEDAERMRRLADVDDPEEGLRALAELMCRVVAAPAHLLAEYELYLLAARRPELREPTRRWLAAVERFGRRHTDDPVRLRVLAGTIDGVLMQALLTDTPPGRQEWEEILRAVLLTPGPETRR
ncbi:TetR/AcrR family transcriptional regulator [Nonomuraea endophytica]|uniref:DNA-binding transcriptional regulator YbjK n=1 Tax=Nonomuraea endophytica TaxID=714136 RepID=A0A7W8AGP8_9ACTN|nr:TetR family transcriptional regulator [Nonomuraea endophytica]MBB5084498.1 DNA-binding transcriptional regulator YbjK [Nonomuraea endophytica]